jgi:hypothetical protein
MRSFFLIFTAWTAAIFERASRYLLSSKLQLTFPQYKKLPKAISPKGVATNGSEVVLGDVAWHSF